jgi:hypothetical protein
VEPVVAEPVVADLLPEVTWLMGQLLAQTGN